MLDLLIIDVEAWDGEMTEAERRQLIERVGRERAHANYRGLGGGNKAAVEYEVARELCNHLTQNEGCATLRLEANKPDPPDCIAIDPSGLRMAIEVTELVDEEAARQGEREKRNLASARSSRTEGEMTARVGALWSADRLLEEVRSRIMTKDKTLVGDFSAYFLAIHTDEPGITYELVNDTLSSLVFKTTAIDKAFLHLSYHPHYVGSPEGVPIFRIPIKRT